MIRAIIDIYIAIAIAVMGLVLLVWAWANLRKGLRTIGWGRVEGEVISSKSDQTGRTIEFDHPTYQVRAHVTYEVNGNTYQTQRVHDFIGDVESIGKPGKIPKKSKVTVYYNPKNPGEAVLDRAALRFGIFLGLLGIGFFVLEWHWVSKTFF